MGRLDRQKRKQAARDKQRSRQVKQSIEFDLKKQPKIVDSVTDDKQKIQWCFELFDYGYDWRGNGSIAHASFTEVAQHLKSYSTMTWNEVKRNHTRDHAVAIGDLCKEAQVRLAYLNQDDADELWRLRFTGPWRIWGIRMGHVLRLIWWDPDHRVCPSNRD